MKIELPTFKNIIKSIIIALILSVAGYFLFPYLNLNELAQTNPARLLTYSVLVGSIIAGILATTSMDLSLIGSKEASVFVGNLAFKASAGDLRELFEDYGDGEGVSERVTGRPGLRLDELGARDDPRADVLADRRENRSRGQRHGRRHRRRSRHRHRRHGERRWPGIGGYWRCRQRLW